jgi:DNA repair exonuclease SbcCD nuclease subunit
VHTLSTRRPESIELEQLGIVGHGQGFATRDVSVDLAASYPAARRGFFNIGLLHTALGGRPGHTPYAPTTLEVLASKGYDSWALGHVHTREVVSLEPLVIFPGNLQGRHAKEIGAKGATVLTLEDGRVAEHRHEVLDTVRWAQCTVDAASAQNGDDIIELARKQLALAARHAEGRLLAARLTISGATAAHAQLVRNPDRWIAQLRSMAFELGDGEVWLEKIVLNTASRAQGAQLPREDALGQLVAQIDALAADPSVLAQIAERFTDLRKRLPATLLDTPLEERALGDADLEREQALRIDDPAFLMSLLPEVKELLLARLSEEEGA